MALFFPVGPSIGDLYPPDPGVSGVSQYIWRGNRWDAVTPNVSLGTANQGVYNDYQWPTLDGAIGEQLTTDGLGGLSWEPSAVPSLITLSVLQTFDGVLTSFTLIDSGTSTPFAPSPSANIIVFLGGVPQIPTAAYTVSGNTITFTSAPLAGSTIYAISSTVI
jgi:hypothetical protein